MPTPIQQHAANSAACSLSKDPFVQKVIKRKIGQLLTFPEFRSHEEEDLNQELLSQLDSAMKNQRDELGHRNPYIVMVIERKASNLLQYRRQMFRAEQNIGSLNVTVNDGDGKSRELIQCISEDDHRRKLETTSRSETDRVDLPHDLQAVMKTLPTQWQEFLRLLGEHTVSDAARIMGVPRSTLKSWMPKIAQIFEEAGLRDYLS